MHKYTNQDKLINLISNVVTKVHQSILPFEELTLAENIYTKNKRSYFVA